MDTSIRSRGDRDYGDTRVMSERAFPTAIAQCHNLADVCDHNQRDESDRLCAYRPHVYY